MPIVSMKALLESGVHFGHRTHKWHPRMKPFIFTERNSIHIIDLQKTVKALEEAYALVRSPFRMVARFFLLEPNVRRRTPFNSMPPVVVCPG